MSAVVLALTASAGYGASDFVAGLLVRRLPSVLVALWSQVLGTVAFVALAATSAQTLDATGAAWGVAAGVTGAVALLLFYRALELGETSVVAPVAATGTLIPVAAQAIGGDVPSPLALAGIPLAVGGLMLLSLGGPGEPSPGRRTAGVRTTTERAADAGASSRAVVLALLSAVGFGTFFVLLDAGTAAAPDTELWVLAAVLVGALPLTVAVAARAGERLLPALVLAPIVVVALLDLGADAALTFATTEGELGTVGVLASLDPLVSVLLAVVVSRERMPRRQVAGVIACLGGVLLVAAA